MMAAVARQAGACLESGQEGRFWRRLDVPDGMRYIQVVHAAEEHDGP